MIGTPTPAGLIREKIAERERQMQTSFPAKVVAGSYDASLGTVTVEPQFFEAWREGAERVTEAPAQAADAYIENVPVAFPRSGDFCITFPIADDSFGLVTCTKYSLDVWREAGNVSDPGDLRRFTMSGAVFHPVNLYPEESNIGTVGTVDETVFVLSEDPSNADWLCLYTETKQNLDDILTALDHLESKFNAHTHVYNLPLHPAVPPTGPTAAPTSPAAHSYAVTDPQNAKVKVE